MFECLGTDTPRTRPFTTKLGHFDTGVGPQLQHDISKALCELKQVRVQSSYIVPMDSAKKCN